MNKLKEIENASKRIRRSIITMTYNAGSYGAHIGGGLSLPEILATLYLGVMNISPCTKENENRDRFVLSKGHGAIALYATLKEAGFITEEQLLTFKYDGADFWTHPCKNTQYGIEFSSGSLGQGLSLAAGVALALRRKCNSAHIYVVIGDGECDEGAIWEAASFISHHMLNNITVIVDENKLQLDAPTKEIINKEDLSRRWEAFGFETIPADGHNVENLLDAFNHKSEKPIAIIARTVKGKGVSFIENNPEWHVHPLTKEQFKQAIKELDDD